MNKLYGTIIGMLLGIIGSVIWIYRDTLVHPDCNSLWKCSSSALFKFGIGKFLVIVALAAAFLGFLIGFIMDKRYNAKFKSQNACPQCLQHSCCRRAK